jgi:dTMP kinase
MQRGLVVSFEGGEGSGKTTQFDLVCLHFDNTGIPYQSYREPGGTEISEEIREVLLRPRKTIMSDWAELLLFEAARAQIVYEMIQPALTSGQLVLLDRFLDSSSAYQGYGRGLDVGQITFLNRIATQGIKPHKTFYFDVDPKYGLLRGTKEGKDRIEAAEMDFHERVRQGYLAMAAKEPQRFIVLNGHDLVETLHVQVMQEISRLLGR